MELRGRAHRSDFKLLMPWVRSRRQVQQPGESTGTAVALRHEPQKAAITWHQVRGRVAEWLLIPCAGAHVRAVGEDPTRLCL